MTERSTPTASDMELAEAAVSARDALQSYGSCERDELSQDGQRWLALVIRNACKMAQPAAPSPSADHAVIAHELKNWTSHYRAGVVGDDKCSMVIADSQIARCVRENLAVVLDALGEAGHG